MLPKTPKMFVLALREGVHFRRRGRTYNLPPKLNPKLSPTLGGALHPQHPLVTPMG